jgi:hypothetical protein
MKYTGDRTPYKSFTIPLRNAPAAIEAQTSAMAEPTQLQYQ